MRVSKGRARSIPRIPRPSAYHGGMEYLIAFLAVVCLFVALAPEAVTQTALAGVWVLFALFIAGEIIYYLGRFLLALF